VNDANNVTKKKKLATLWLDGCSGCHMSMLDMDLALIDLADIVELVYSPLIDNKHFPEDVDIALVEGAVSSEDDLEKIKLVRARTKTLVAFGDCAVTGNIPSMRNRFKVPDLLQTVYGSVAIMPASDQGVPMLLPNVRPIGHVVPVDVYLPGCPPSATLILRVVQDLVAGRVPDLGPRAMFG